MTLQITGFVKSLETNAGGELVAVIGVPKNTYCLVLVVPKDQASSWIPGMDVTLTAYTTTPGPPQPSNMKGI